MQFGIAIEQALRNFLEGIQVFAEQKHRFGTDPLQGQKLTRRLADALGQHHQLTGCSHLGRGRALLHLERSNGFGILEQLRRLPVDGAQGTRDLGQNFLLPQHYFGIALRTFYQGGDGVELGLE